MESDVQPKDDRHWSLESLNKAYQQGYMAGLTGQPKTRHGHRAEVLAAAWEAGWDDGHEQLLRQQKSA
ncbi:ribosome modulation factor [Pseudomonas sp. SA3-5]|uniref:Ribosome modulation factor n=1 Tax=Pseudomonas aestuarii TaxID=3018340 RepID=A0ABT4XL14_9PSED|nr:ribosome modulation factor [Pseudomonas aestuarii]MDA7088916.1 ribosome modulation factor [Pseudomonas aestuarii]